MTLTAVPPLNRVGTHMQETVGVRMSPWMDVSTVLNDHDKDFMLYNPANIMEQQQVAAMHLPQFFNTPAQYIAKTRAAVKLIEDVQHGRGGAMNRVRLLEAISYDDFNYIMQDIIYRKMLEKWSIPDSPYENWSKEIKVPTMQRPGKMFTLDGIETPIPLVHPGEQPTLRSPYDSGIAVRPYKYMADVELLWETMLEDDLNALSDIPSRLTNAIKATKGRINTGTYADSGGFRDALGGPFFVTNNDKILNPTLATATAKFINNMLTANNQFGIASNAPLTLPAIQAARTQVSKFLSPDDNPIDVKLMHLVVGNGMAEIARNVLGAQSYQMERAGGLEAGAGAAGATSDGFVRMTVSKDSIAGLSLHVDPYLHVVVNGSKADTMWMLVADKNIARPMFAHCLLAGHEMPIVQRRVPNYRGVGQNNGQNVDWISTGFRCGFIYGTQWGDARGAVASEGQ